MSLSENTVRSSLSMRGKWRRPEPSMQRADRPPIMPGTLVWWRSGLYKVETLEFQAGGWTAVLVRPRDFGSSGTHCWFAPVETLTVD